MKKNKPTRRDFVKTSALAAASFMIFPRHVLGGTGFTAPSDTVNIAGIGAAGRALQNFNGLVSPDVNVVALAEVDWSRVDQFIATAANPVAPRGGGAGTLTANGTPGVQTSDQAEQTKKRIQQAENYKKAIRFDDYRVMLEKQKGIDGVVITTPDHTHAHAAIMSMELGYHCYCEKPLTHNIVEARKVLKVAQRKNVVTQMGNTGHSNNEARHMVEMLWAGAIGPIKEVHVWTNRPSWPQGIARPAPSATPKNLKWDLWLGPAPSIPYNEGIHPFNWRGYIEYGTGPIGDMGAHQLDFVFRALNLGLPTRVEARHSPWGGTKEEPRVTYPSSSTIYWEFGNGGQDPVHVTWYDGGLMPPTPVELPKEMHKRMAPGTGGVIYIGEKGKLITGARGTEPYFMPAHLNAEYAKVPQRLHRIEGSANGHQMNWIRAIRGTEEISCPFEFGVPVVETMLLGMAALRAEVPLDYDAINMKFTNYNEANQYLDREKIRVGWVI